jgi:hypothetical protein
MLRTIDEPGERGPARVVSRLPPISAAVDFCN